MKKVKERTVGEVYKPLDGFGKLFKAFFGNGEASIDDKDLDVELNKIIAEQDSSYIEKQEKAIASNGSKAGGKKSDRIKVKSNKEDVKAKQTKARERDEER